MINRGIDELLRNARSYVENGQKFSVLVESFGKFEVEISCLWNIKTEIFQFSEVENI